MCVGIYEHVPQPTMKRTLLAQQEEAELELAKVQECLFELEPD